MPNTANFDRVARMYSTCEYLALGRLLEAVRFTRIPELRECRTALVLGDGDGRFLARLLAANPEIQVTCVDASAAMLELARERVTRLHALDRVTFVQADLRDYTPGASYDLITTHFVLDCFLTQELHSLLPRYATCLASNGVWLHSEFRLPLGWLRPVAQIYTGALYLAFAALTGLATRKLPDDAAALASAGLACHSQRHWLGGMLVSEAWKRHV